MKQSRDFISSSDVNKRERVGARPHPPVESRRKVMNLFTHEALPATGMTVEYLTLDANSMKVAKQATEGTALTYGELSFRQHVGQRGHLRRDTHPSAVRSSNAARPPR